MINIQRSFVMCKTAVGSYRMAYSEYWQGLAHNKPPSNLPVLICVHGLTRVGGDFDALARKMSKTHRVICPDIVGRGHSDWLSSQWNSAHYQIPSYVADIITLIRHINVERVDWVGTSMGGLIGIALASHALQNPHEYVPTLQKMVLNDIGIRIPRASLQRIAGYVGHPPSWSNFEEALNFYKNNYTSFGINTDSDWQKFTYDSIRFKNNRWTTHYDPRIADSFVASSGADIDLTSIFQAIKQPLLVIRGAQSDVLLDEDYQRMLSQSNVQGYLVQDCGHAPALLAEDQIATIFSFLNQ